MANRLVVEASRKFWVGEDGCGLGDFKKKKDLDFFSKQRIFEFIRDLIYKEFLFLVDNIVDLGFVEIIFVVCVNLDVLWATNGLDFFFFGFLYHSHFLKRVFLN